MFDRLVLLHHTGATNPDSPWYQQAIDSDAGIVTGIFLHTFGALLFAAGLALYLYQARIVNRARETGDKPSLQYLPLAHILNLGGIGLNGAGGLMRLFQSDHPGLELLGSSYWVQLIFVKHLFLVAGVGLATFLTFWTFRLAGARGAPANFYPHTGRMTNTALASVVSILAASALGALAANVNLAEDLGMGDEGPPTNGALGPHAATNLQYARASGKITGTPATPGRGTLALNVSDNATEVWGQVTWQNAQRSILDLHLEDPAGNRASATRTSTTSGSAGRVQIEYRGPIAAGDWTLVVTSQQAVDEAYLVLGRITKGVVPFSVEETYAVNPKSLQGIVELNLKMQLGARINYTWEVLNSPQVLDFNIHTHPPGAPVTYPVQGSWNRLSGHYIHEETRTDRASLMWENPGSAVVQVHYRVEGQFTVHSRFIR